MNYSVTQFLELKIPGLERKRKTYHFLGRIGKYLMPVLYVLFKLFLVALLGVFIIVPFFLSKTVDTISLLSVVAIVCKTIIGWLVVFSGTFMYLVVAVLIVGGCEAIFINTIETPIKKTVLPRLLQLINSSYVYKRYTWFDEAVFRKAGIFKASSFKDDIIFEGKDEVSGTTNGVDFIWAEMVAYRKIKGSRILGSVIPFSVTIFSYLISLKVLNEHFYVKGKGHLYKKFFRGIFLQADFNKEFEGRVFICPKGILNQYNFLSNTEGMMQVQLDNGAFNDGFVVYTTQKETAFYVISPSIIDLMVSLKEAQGVAPIMSFNEGSITALFPGDKDYFKYKNETPITGVSYFEKTIEEIKTYDEMIQLFGLQHKIWTKV